MSGAKGSVSAEFPEHADTESRRGPWAFVTLLSLLATIVLWIPLEQWLLGGVSAAIFAASLVKESPTRRLRYGALASAVLVLTLAPINTRTDNQHSLTMALFFLAALVLPTALLWRQNIITFKFLPDRLDWVDVAYTLLSVPLAWGGFRLYFGVLSPEVPFNWTLPPTPDNEELLRLFLGINAVGIWDELFFVNIGYAVLRALFPARVANPAQAVLYTAVLYDMAFTGWGPLFVYTLALTQGAMFERSKVLLYVLVVHLIVDYFLFQEIVSAYYPGLSVWWH